MYIFLQPQIVLLLGAAHGIISIKCLCMLLAFFCEGVGGGVGGR